MSESYIEKVYRVQMMAEGNPAWDLSDTDIAALSAVLAVLTIENKVCAEIAAIMVEYDRQEKSGGVDSPGGLEHMGDVWTLLRKWQRMIAKAMEFL